MSEELAEKVAGEAREADVVGQPSVITVVLNWCTEAATRSCVEALLAEPGGQAQVAVLVVDNASPDRSGERLERWVEQLALARGESADVEAAHVSFLQTGANLGYAGGNSAGIAWALEQGADWVLVINPDVAIEPGLVDALLEAGAGGEAGADRVAAVCPTLMAEDRAEWANYAGGLFDRKRALGVPVTGPVDEVAPRQASPRPVTFVHGGCVLLRAEALREVGAFRTDFFMYVEDAELALRLHRAEWVMLHQPAARARHAGDEFGDPIAWKLYLRDRNRKRLVHPHYGWVDRLRFALWFYPTRLVHGLRYLLRGDQARAVAIFTAMLGLKLPAGLPYEQR